MKHRVAIAASVYLVLFTACYVCAWLVRFEFQLDERAVTHVRNTLGTLLVVKFAACLLTREFQRRFRHTTVYDAISAGSGAIGALKGC